jgi:hypothetical protein
MLVSSGSIEVSHDFDLFGVLHTTGDLMLEEVSDG